MFGGCVFAFNSTDYSPSESVKREQTMNNASGCNTADDNVTTRMATVAATMTTATMAAATMMMQFQKRKNKKKNETICESERELLVLAYTPYKYDL